MVRNNGRTKQVVLVILLLAALGLWGLRRREARPAIGAAQWAADPIESDDLAG